jgi:hypothetical protein
MTRGKLISALLVAVPLGTLVQACSLAEPRPKDFVLVSQTPAKAAETGNTLQAATKACQAETERKVLGSVVAIFSRLRKDSLKEDYVTCMKARGYEAKS